MSGANSAPPLLSQCNVALQWVMGLNRNLYADGHQSCPPNKICHELIKALGVAGLSWLTCLCNVFGAVALDWQTGGDGSPF